MHIAQQGKESISELRQKLLNAIAEHGITRAPDGTLDIRFSLANPDNCWGGMEEMKVVKIDFQTATLITEIYGGKTDEVYYPEFGISELCDILEQLEQIGKD